MITLKPRKPKKLLKSIEQNDNDSYSLSLNYGLATIDSTINIIGIELDVSGKFSFSSKLPDGWIAEAGAKKILIVDTKMVGIKEAELFTFTGKLKIKKATIIDSNSQIVTFGKWTDKNLHVWDLSEGNQFDSNTTAWDSLSSQNVNTRYIKDDSTEQTDYQYAADYSVTPKKLGGG